MIFQERTTNIFTVIRTFFTTSCELDSKTEVASTSFESVSFLATVSDHFYLLSISEGFT